MVYSNFTQISNVDQSSGFSFFANTSINNEGTVVFEAFRQLPIPTPDPIFIPTTILSGGGGAATSVSGNSFDLAFQPSINNKGVTSFVGSSGLNSDFIPTSTGVYTSYNGTPQNVVDSSGEFSNFGLTSINDKGNVSFYATLDSGATGIFTSSGGGEVKTIAQSSGDLFSNFNAGLSGEATGRGDGPFSGFSLTSINNEGTVAFTAGLDQGGTGIFIGSGEDDITTIADTSSDSFEDFNFQTFASASINDSETVAFLAAFDADSDGTASTGIFTSQDGELTNIADTSGIFSAFGSEAAINNQGVVAFLAELDNGVTGIFTGTELSDKVIAVGDQLAGSQVVSLVFSQDGLNDSGQLAFGAVLADNRQVIFRAEAVPEPGESMVLVLTLGIFFVFGWRWRQRMRSAKPTLH